MANLSETATYEAGIYQLETSDRAKGGASGVSNLQAKQLANRTAYLKSVVDGLSDGSSIGSYSLSRNKMVNGAIGGGSTVRNCALAGPVTASGLPAAIAYVNTGSFTIGSNSVNLYMSFAGGYDTSGQIDYTGVQSTQVTISSIPSGSGTVYVFCERNASNGALSFGTITGAYSVQWVAPTSPTTSDLWLDLSTMTMKRYNGSVWIVVQVVVLGEFQRTSGAISGGAVTCYEYRQPLEFFNSTPVGTLIAKASKRTPSGYLYCDGSNVSRTIYARLFAEIGTTYGTGDGSTTFTLPDLRGEFLRGFDDGRGVDTSQMVIGFNTTNGSATITINDGVQTNTSGLVVGMAVTGTGIPANTTISSIPSRTTVVLSNNATATGTGVSLTFTSIRTIGSKQSDMIAGHLHDTGYINGVQGSGTVFKAVNTGFGSGIAATTVTGGAETRPRNVAVAYYIKF